MLSIKAVSFGTPAAAPLPAARRSSQTDAKRRSGRSRRIVAAALGAAVLALVLASAAAAASTAYISNATKDVVTPINLETSKVETGINVGALTSSIAITGESAFAPVLEGETLIPINLKTSAAETPIALTSKKEKIEPEAVAVTPNGEYVYVAEEETNSVKEIKVATKAVVNTISVGEEPEGIAITPNGEFAYVADKAGEKQGRVTVIEKASTASAKVKTTINIGTATGCLAEGKNPAKACVEPEKIAITPNGEFAYVADGANGTVTVIEISTNKVKAEIEVGKAEVSATEPDNIAITPDGKTAYAADGSEGEVDAIEIKTKPTEDKVVAKISVGTATSLPHGLAITSDGKLVVVANEEEGKVKTIETATNTVANTFSIEGEPDGVAITP